MVQWQELEVVEQNKGCTCKTLNNAWVEFYDKLALVGLPSGSAALAQACPCFDAPPHHCRGRMWVWILR
eukprot:376785-Amphidinium_carterae.2